MLDDIKVLLKSEHFERALGLLEFHAVNGTFFVDPEPHAYLVAGDGPSASGAVLGNRARASALPRVSAAWAQPRSANARILNRVLRWQSPLGARVRAQELLGAERSILGQRQQRARAGICPCLKVHPRSGYCRMGRRAGPQPPKIGLTTPMRLSGLAKNK